MNKFTKILEQNEELNYYKVSTELELSFSAYSEGEAGYLADSILGSIKEQSDFVVKNISQISKEEFNKLFESVEISNWKEIDGSLQRAFEFSNFKEALNFINIVGEIYEKENHHPEIQNIYNKVILKLKTHDQNKITDLDYKVAKLIDDAFDNSK